MPSDPPSRIANLPDASRPASSVHHHAARPLPASLIHPATVMRLQWFGQALALLSFALGLTVFIGWVFDSHALRAILANEVEMKTNTAIALMCLGLGVWLLTHRDTRWTSLVGVFLASVAGVIGVATLAQYAFGWNLGIDTLLFTEPMEPGSKITPNRMGLPAGVTITLLSATLLLLDRRLDRIWPSQWLALGAAIVPIVPILGYVYGEQVLSGVSQYTGISFPQAVALLLVAVATVLIRPDVGFMRIVAADDAGGTLLRKMLPPMVALTLVFGWMKVYGVRHRYFEVEFGEAVLTVMLLALFLVLLWSTARAVGDLEAARRVAERDREHLLVAEREARAESERAGRVKDDFLATLSHELRTPMTAILGWSQIMRRKGGTADGDQAAEIIERNARVQAQIIDDLLDMSRIVSGKLRLDVQSVRMLDVVEAALATARPAADNREIRLHPTLEHNVGAVRGDPARLQQVVWNLLSNAIKFTPRCGRVGITLERLDWQVELAVSDTGQGIDPHFLPHVFERFSQGDASAARRHGGLGIGLAVAKQLVELHGGTITAESQGLGRGATFRIRLPLVIVHASDDHSPRAHPRALAHRPNAATADLSGVRVLLVDDEPDARTLVRRLLEECHADVTDADSAHQALAHFQEQPFDVVVSDIGMPGMDGHELIQRIRAMERSSGHMTPAMALTAFARPEDRTRAISSGYQVHAAKPIEPTELIAGIATLVQTQRQTGVIEKTA